MTRSPQDFQALDGAGGGRYHPNLWRAQSRLGYCAGGRILFICILLICMISGQSQVPNGPGVTIGDRAVIGAGSVVTKDIPAGVIAVGNPCRVVKEV